MKSIKTGIFILVAALLQQQISFAAPPPSLQTSEETLWNALSVSAGIDLNSDQTNRLIDQFLEKYPDNVRAMNVRYILAEKEFRATNYQKAAVRYEAFLSRYPESEISDSAAFRLGECYFNAGAFNSAGEAWDRMVKKYKHSALIPNAMEYLAILSMRTREWGKADELMGKIKSAYPEYAGIDRVRENRGVILYYLGDFGGSAKILEGIDEGKGAYYRGLSLFSLTLYEDAVNSLKNITNDLHGPYAESAGFLKSEGFFQKQNYNLASREFETFLKNFPTSSLVPYAQLRIGACALLVHEPETALKASDEAMKGSSAIEIKSYGMFIKASAYLDLGKYRDAADLFGQLSKSKEYPSLAAASLVRKAWAHRNLQEISLFTQALKTLEEQYPSSSQMALGKFLEGAFLFEQGNWENAGNRLEASVIRYPYSPISEAGLALMSIAYTKANRQDHLLTAANSALKIFEGNYTPETGEWRAQSYFYVGKAYYDMNRFTDAIPFFEKITIRYSSHALAPRAELYLAWSLVENNQLDKAREKAKMLIDNKKTDKLLATNATFLYAVSYFNGKQYDKALPRLSDFLKQHPEDSLAPQARYLMGLAFFEKKVYGSAVDEWQKCIKDYPESAYAQDAYLHIGDLYFKANKFEEAGSFFNQFRAKWPQSKYVPIAMWLEMQSYFNGKLDDKAIHIYPEFIKRYPTDENVEDAKRQLETVYYRRGAHGDPEKLQQFLSLYPKSPYAPAARYKLGDMAMEQQNWVRATQEMEQFLRDYPKDQQSVDALYALGLAYEKQGLKEKAIIQYNNLITQFPTKSGAVDASFRLGMLFFQQENYKEAIRAFQFGLSKKLTDEQRASALYNTALSYENTGQLEEAANTYALFAKVSKNKGQVNEALMTAGLLMKKAEKYDKAVPYFQQLLKSAGDKDMELQAVTLVAECYKSSGNEAKAMENYEKLIAMEPANSDVRLAGMAQLAYMYEQKRDFSKATRVYEKIAVSGGKKDWVKAARERIDAISKIKANNEMP